MGSKQSQEKKTEESPAWNIIKGYSVLNEKLNKVVDYLLGIPPEELNSLLRLELVERLHSRRFISIQRQVNAIVFSKEFKTLSNEQFVLILAHLTRVCPQMSGLLFLIFLPRLQKLTLQNNIMPVISGVWLYY